MASHYPKTKRLTSRFLLYNGNLSFLEYVKGFCSEQQNRAAGECLWVLALRVGSEPSLLRELVEQFGANPEHSISGLTPLHAAAISGNDAVIEPLLLLGASPDVKDFNGFSPLFTAMLFGNDEFARKIVECGASSKKACPVTWNYTARMMRHFTENDKDENWKWLNVPDLPKLRENELGGAICEQEAQFFRNYWLFHSCYCKNPKKNLCEQLLADGASPCALIGHTTALHAATTFGNTSILRLLVKSGCVDEPDAFCWTPLMQAIFQSNAKAAAVLTEKGASWDASAAEGTVRDIAESCNADIAIQANGNSQEMLLRDRQGSPGVRESSDKEIKEMRTDIQELKLQVGENMAILKSVAAAVVDKTREPATPSTEPSPESDVRNVMSAQTLATSQKRLHQLVFVEEEKKKAFIESSFSSNGSCIEPDAEALALRSDYA